jgi:tetratricopeptide (TPR) repeat protein
MVMRALHDLAEYDELRREFDTLTDREREALLASRKVHKEQVIFLHEWAHTLGLIHNRRPSAVMSPSYANDQVGFDDTEARLVEIALRHRKSDGARWREGAATELRPLVEKSPDPDWDPRDRQELLAMLTPVQRTAAPPAATQPPPGPVEGPLGAAERATVEEARVLAEAQRYDEALRKLAPLEAHHARSPEVRLAVCELAWRHPPGAARAALAEAACGQAVEIAPKDPRPQLYLADLYLSAGDFNRARAPLARVEELLTAAGDPAAWRQLALTLKKARLPTLAARAAHHADAETAATVDAWAAELRKKMALPADGLMPEAEAEYIHVVETARAAFATRGEGAAIASAESEFAGLGDVLLREAAEARRHHRR